MMEKLIFRESCLEGSLIKSHGNTQKERFGIAGNIEQIPESAVRTLEDADELIFG